MGDNLKGKTVSGIIWIGIERASAILIQFIIGIILARILAPSDFGLIGMIAIFMAISDTIVESGFANALIQKKDVSPIDYSTALIFNASLGVGLYVILYVSSPYIADFYNSPILNDIIRVYTLIVVINSLIVAQLAKLSIDLKFRTQSIITITTSLVSGVLGIVLAYSGFGVWALVFQSLSGAFLRLIFITIVAKMNFRIRFSRESFAALWSFGSKILCSGMINTIYNNLYTLVIGKAYNPLQVGYYNRAEQFGRLPSNTLTSIIIRVIFPILSKIQDDNERLAATYAKFIKLIMFLLAPIMSAMFVMSKQIILVTVGEQWIECVPLLQVLCGCYLFDALTHLNLNLLYVKGRTDLVLRLEFMKKPIGFILLIISIPFGVLFMCIGRTIYSIIAFCFNCMYTKKILNIGLWKQLKYVVPIIIRSTITGLIVYLVIQGLGLSPFWELLVGCTLGAFLYLGLSLTMRDESLYSMKEVICNMRNTY